MIYHDISQTIVTWEFFAPTNVSRFRSSTGVPHLPLLLPQPTFHDFAETPKETNSHQRRPASNPGTSVAARCETHHFVEDLMGFTRPGQCLKITNWKDPPNVIAG